MAQPPCRRLRACRSRQFNVHNKLGSEPPLQTESLAKIVEAFRCARDLVRLGDAAAQHHNLYGSVLTLKCCSHLHSWSWKLPASTSATRLPLHNRRGVVFPATW